MVDVCVEQIVINDAMNEWIEWQKCLCMYSCHSRTFKH